MSLNIARVSWQTAFVVCGALGLLVLGLDRSGQTPAVSAQASNRDMVERGEYLVLASGCHDCHTPHIAGPEGLEPDMSRALSGHPADQQLPTPPPLSGPWMAAVTGTFTAWAGPWGVSYTQNITPDPETGIGNYTEEQFVMTIREGKKQGRGRALLPPMPWPAIRNFSDEDLRAIYAYLRTVKPLKNKVPDPVIAEME